MVEAPLEIEILVEADSSDAPPENPRKRGRSDSSKGISSKRSEYYLYYNICIRVLLFLTKLSYFEIVFFLLKSNFV